MPRRDGGLNPLGAAEIGVREELITAG